ncbi:hypothetical protein JVU11DRAFT_1623 [Chiua virens]|nr:hypothetical protein JVU11DRAFT_1623 [Chiua virens]
MLGGASNGYEAIETTQLGGTLRTIDEITNMDVEMQVPLTEQYAVIVLDTNILLEFLDIIQTFVSEVEQQQLPVLVIIPGAVIHELDVQKNRDRLSWFARRASTWLLKKVKERRNVKGQALEETCKSSGNWKVKEPGEELGTERANDGLILDCCQYFFRTRQCRTLLCSKDKLLAVEAESVGIPTLFPNQGLFCSRDIAVAVFGPEALTLRFSGRFESYRGDAKGVAHDSTKDDDGMDVDDESAVTELVRPSHPLDLLHLQVIDHFGELLLELVAKIAGPEAQKFGAPGMMSRHAPAYTRKPLRYWTTSDALEYLNTKKQWPKSSPRVDVFLMQPYKEKRTGARKGQDWSRRDWEVAVGSLGKIGDLWVDGESIRESVSAVEVEMRSVFEQAMRPTGMGRRTFYIALVVLGLVLLGTVLVLSSISYYLAINAAAYLSNSDVPILNDTTRWNATQHGMVERIPRILHQTWKSETLPPKWKNISEACRDMMNDYEYMLWTDASSREFIAEYYPWFLDTFDNYEYVIQRADVIRYFVLHHYGGIYLDLDIGCVRPLDPLLVYPVILPKTIPVGVSNDLIFAEKRHPFFAQTIHNLVTFDHDWLLNYPTVMFSTGPMFLSAQYSIYTSSHPITPDKPGDVRILPKSLYGKNAKPGEAPHSFFTHFYGSSWHADDAPFIGFLSHWGKPLMWLGLVVLLWGIYRLVMSNNSRKYSLRRIGGYEVLLPRWTQRNGRWHIDMRWSTLPPSATSTQPPSPSSSPLTQFEEHVSLLPLPFDVRSDSPAPSEISSSVDMFPTHTHRGSFSLLDTVYRIRERAATFFTHQRDNIVFSRPFTRHRRHRTRGVMFFLPAIFTQSQSTDISPRSSPPPQPYPQISPEKPRYPPDVAWMGSEADPFSHQGSSQLFRAESRLSSSQTLIDVETAAES